jgi:hypothetical protein
MNKCVDCPVGWELFKSKCVLIVKNRNITWDNARKECINYGVIFIIFGIHSLIVSN